MWKNPYNRAFSLVELLISTSALMLLMSMVFLLFGYSYRGFHLSTSRQDVQNQVLRARQWLERDFQLTHLGSVGVFPREVAIEGTEHRRDSICALALSEWSDASLYFPTGLPRWDRYVLYFCTTEDEGNLIRQELLPGDLAPPLRVRPYPKLYTLSDPASLPPGEIVNSRILATDVLSFECLIDPRDQAVLQTLKISIQGGSAGLGTQKIHETLEATFRWEALNSTPRL